jgi:transcriptional regulator with XRE-family HTH domain
VTPAELVAELYEARIDQGLSIEAVYRLAGRGGGNLSDWERGRKDPQLSGFVAVTEALGLEVIVRPKGRQR